MPPAAEFRGGVRARCHVAEAFADGLGSVTTLGCFPQKDQQTQISLGAPTPSSKIQKTSYCALRIGIGLWVKTRRRLLWVKLWAWQKAWFALG